MASKDPLPVPHKHKEKAKTFEKGGRTAESRKTDFAENNATQANKASSNSASGITAGSVDTDNWVEIIIRDEFNEPFANVKGNLIDSSDTKHPIALNKNPIFVSGTSPGTVRLELEPTSWLKEAQKSEHKPNLGEDPVRWFARSYTGHQSSSPDYLTVTAGDLTAPTEDITLPPRHVAKQADNLHMETGRSYVLRVKGFNYKTLRLGVFFDGTGNNNENHQQGLAELQQWLKETCDDPAEAADEFENCRLGTTPVEGSYANDMTNIGKLSKMYGPPITSDRHIFPAYIDGIGTVSGNNDSLMGSAVSLGDTSVKARVVQACQLDIKEYYREQISSNDMTDIDGYSKIEFDVFGFSRGAAAARHFVNTIDQNNNHGLIESLTNINGLHLKAGFNWSDRKDSRVTFVGIFDTVESAWQDTMLGLSPDCAERVVHLTAADEYRKNFPLTRITNDVNGSQIASNFTEVVLPGAHSDVGGGYYSRHTLGYGINPDPALTEYLRLRYFVSIENNLTQHFTKSQAYKKAIQYAQHKQKLGWADRIVTFTDPNRVLNDGEIGLRVRTFRRNHRQSKKSVHVDVLMYRVVEGELSRIPLHMMVKAGQAEGVPFHEWKTGNKILTTKTNRTNIPIDLSKLEITWLKTACIKGGVKEQYKELPTDVYRTLRRYYCHHSSHENGALDKLVNQANYSFWDSGEIANRELLPNTPGQTS
ncbi:VgrG protein [Photobacterium marinum]|uniref:VgrG protein n=1 Tax=Photobacterium marinum TaxID=1056511 RepID=L8JK08_9GAMM|nr:DUF2235 domain-containing protein [Photobacterium marinum]ELR67819.1 VgrG protein [Photobacterium marinum]